MALIKCPECGKEISDQAKACIFCGYPIPKAKPTVKTDDTEQLPLKEEIIEQQSEVEPQNTELSTTSPTDEKRKKTITTVAISVLLIVLAIWGITTAVKNNTAKTRDLSDVFDFSFDMTMDDIIEYEAEKYGNTEYECEYLTDKIRLDFEKYSYDDWKHRYFFDKETGLLISLHYSGVIVTFGDKDGAECEHVRPIKRALLNEIGEWDEKATGNSVRSVAYGQIDGVPCKILYFDGATEEISIHMQDD